MVVSIRVRNLVFRRKDFLLRIPKLDFEEARLTAIVGPNGAGKTTLLKCLAGLLPFGPGTLFLNDKNLAFLSAAERARRMSFVPQEHSSAFNYSVLDFILMGRAPYLGIFSVPSEKDAARAVEALAFVGLPAALERPYIQLSSGERRLILIARALAQNTDILILDEPTTFLDPRHETEVMNLARQMVVEHGKTVLVTLHNLDMAARYADTLVFLKNGAVAAQGRPADILTEDLLLDLYEIPMHIIEHQGRVFIVK